MRSVSIHRLLCLFAVAVALVAAGRASQAGCIPRPGDQIIELSVRDACCTTSPELLAKCITVREYAAVGDVDCHQWISSDLAAIVEPTSPDVVTVVYVHGNKVDPCMARDRGLRVYRSLVRHTCDRRPVRFIIFSWPATEVNGLLHDFRVKAARTRPVGWQLAWVLSQLPAENQVSLLGYSYGARIVGGALHVLGGGDLSGLSLHDQPAQPRPPMRVAFLAAATHGTWFGTNGYHSQAMSQIEHLVMLNNHLDPAMRYYKWVDKCSNPQAMGLCGPQCLPPGARSRIECYDCSNCVGRSHDLFKYLATGRTMTRVWQHLTYAN